MRACEYPKPDQAYQRAIKLLQGRYGDKYAYADELVKRLSYNKGRQKFVIRNKHAEEKITSSTVNVKKKSEMIGEINVTDIIKHLHITINKKNKKKTKKK